MGDVRERRNGGRLLGVVIESTDKKSLEALQALSEVTRSTFRQRGWDVARWPTDLVLLLDGVGAKSRIVLVDAHDEQHVFAVADCGAFDLLVGVSSRRKENVPGDRTGNLATNVLLEVLALPDPTDGRRPLYGQVGAEDLNRVWRNDVGAAHVQNHARNWDLILWSARDILDYLIPGTSLMGVIRGNQAAEQATSLVVNSAKHKATAHREGILKYARGQTNPVVRVHPQTRQIEGYDEAVVAAFRDAVRLLRSGASWEETAAAVGSRIPAPRAQQEPDDVHDGKRVRTRAARNAERRARGLPELALRFLPDGAPNPDYRPESIQDLKQPAERLKELLVWGLTVPTRDATALKDRIDVDLDGIAPADVQHEFYATGVYRRLVKDHTLSNSATARYKWAAFDLGMTVDGRCVLTGDDVEFLRSFRTGKAATGSWGNNPLIGVFRVAQKRPVYTRSGWLSGDDGSYAVRGAVTGTTMGLRVWFEPVGATPHSDGCQVLAWIPNADLGPALARMLVDAVSTDHDLGEFRFTHAAMRNDPVVAAKQQVLDVERRHETLVLRLTDPDLSDRTVDGLKRALVAAEAQLPIAQAALADAERAAEAGPATHDDTFAISDLAHLAAILTAAVPLPPKTAERAARLLRTILRDAHLTLQPDSASVRIDATLTLGSPTGILTIPVHGQVPNRSSDPWLAGLAGMWWARCAAPFADLMAERGLATRPATAVRWHEPIAKRLLAEADQRGRPLRGPNLAALLVRCPDPDLLAQIRIAIETGHGTPRLRAFLHEGPDLPRKTRWTIAARELADPQPSAGPT